MFCFAFYWIFALLRLLFVVLTKTLKIILLSSQVVHFLLLSYTNTLERVIQSFPPKRETKKIQQNETKNNGKENDYVAEDEIENVELSNCRNGNNLT